LKGHKIAKVQKEPSRITPKVVSAVFSKVKKGENTVILQAFCGINKVNFFTFLLSTCRSEKVRKFLHRLLMSSIALCQTWQLDVTR
jgi:hypothetical protein